jgi:hypothetical protein
METVIGVAQVAAGALGIGAAYLLHRIRKRKRLGYSLLTNRPLLAFNTPFAVEVHHHGKPVTDPVLAVVRVANIGSIPIEKTDYEQAITITFPGCAMLSAQLTGVQPKELTPALTVQDEAARLEPVLLNPADVVEVQFLLDGRVNGIEVWTRIVGVKSVHNVRLPRDSWDRLWRVSLGELLMALAVSVIAFAGSIYFLAFGGLAIVLALMFLLGGIYFSWDTVAKFRRTRLWLNLPPPKGH